MTVFLLIARYIVAATLLIAALAKLVSPDVRSAATSQMADLFGSGWWTTRSGKALMTAELVAGALAAVPTRLSVLPALAVLAMLTAGAAVLVHRGSSSPCACFGERGRPLSTLHVARNAAVTLFALAALMMGSWTGGWLDAAVAAALGTAIAFLLSRLDDLVEVLRSSPLERKAL